MKSFSLLSGAIALMLTAAPLLPVFTNPAMAGPGRGNHQEQIMKNLNLSEDQKARIKAIREEAKSKMEAVLTEQQKQQLQQAKLNRQNGQKGQRPQLNLSEDQKARMKAIREETKTKMEAVLTEQQKQQLQQMREQRRQNRQQQPR
ncbi:hypothetical protein [Leptolyngbya sp. 'hensonii']|uniref:hypothetical protein n=1 Tax=Leptolyngbya sp. 'hensonii' TaxID=1922337 RepID=UPI000A6A2AB4|nr:hypothetical protein [Leptolyngbya sp. 'hensonii']